MNPSESSRRRDLEPDSFEARIRAVIEWARVRRSEELSDNDRKAFASVPLQTRRDLYLATPLLLCENGRISYDHLCRELPSAEDRMELYQHSFPIVFKNESELRQVSDQERAALRVLAFERLKLYDEIEEECDIEAQGDKWTEEFFHSADEYYSRTEGREVETGTSTLDMIPLLKSYENCENDEREILLGLLVRMIGDKVPVLIFDHKALEMLDWLFTQEKDLDASLHQWIQKVQKFIVLGESKPFEDDRSDSREGTFLRRWAKNIGIDPEKIYLDRSDPLLSLDLRALASTSVEGRDVAITGDPIEPEEISEKLIQKMRSTKSMRASISSATPDQIMSIAIRDQDSIHLEILSDFLEVIEALSVCVGVTGLDLTVTDLNPEDVVQLAEKFPRLRSLTLTFSEFTDFDFVFDSDFEANMKALINRAKALKKLEWSFDKTAPKKNQEKQFRSNLKRVEAAIQRISDDESLKQKISTY